MRAITYSRRSTGGAPAVALTLAVLLLFPSAPATLGVPPAPPKMKLRGYITARVDDSTVAILDDHIQLAKNGHVESHDSANTQVSTFAGLAKGQLVEAEGIWEAKHKFSAEHITVEPGLLDKSVHETAYLQEEPTDSKKIAGGEPAELKADGEWLTIGPKTHREWTFKASAAVKAANGSATDGEGPPANFYAGRQIRYSGVRREDGKIEADQVELHDPAPPNAYNNPHDIKVVPSKDRDSGIDILEFRRGDKVDGRLKLFPVHDVQQYVADLGTSLLPAGARGTTRALEFRFFVIEDPNINAQALPDGTVLVNTGLLGAVENEAELAFALSHEIAHVLQAHVWREANETRGARVAIFIAGLAAYYYVGDLSIFLAGLGMEAVANGHQRHLENQADRLGLQTIIDRGYDPREASRLMRTLIEHSGERTMSRLWSNHDSNVVRGSFLEVQLATQYPQGHFDGAVVDTKAFQAMRDAMGPVKIQ